MLSVKVRGGNSRNEELRTVGVRASVSLHVRIQSSEWDTLRAQITYHGQQKRLVMLHWECLILEFLTIDRFTACTIAFGNVSYMRLTPDLMSNIPAVKSPP